MAADDQPHFHFVETNTELIAPPGCPEIRLHLATSVTPIWLATEVEMHLQNLPPPFWAFAWAGGRALARHILDSPEIVRGRRVLDFAAGSGIVGIAAALAGAAHVEACDIDLVAAAAIEMNALANNVVVSVRRDNVVAAGAGDWNVVLAGDVCYEAAMTDYCFPWLQRLAAEGATVLLADPGRAYLPASGLERVAEYAIATSREIEDRDVRDTVIYRVTG